MAKLNIAEKRLPQDGRINIKIGDRNIDIRVSVIPIAFGERVVLRLLGKTDTTFKLIDLGVDRAKAYQKAVKFTEKRDALTAWIPVTGEGRPSLK